MSAPVLVLADHAAGQARLTPAAGQLLTLARSLTSGGVDALVLTDAIDMEALGALGADRVLSAPLGAAARASVAAADAVVAALEAGSYGLVLLPSDYRGREIAGAVAATTDAGVVSGASSVSYDGGVLEIAKTALAGSWSMRIVVEGQTPVVGVASGAVDEARTASPTTPAVESLEVVLSPRAQAVAVLASTPEETGGVSLADASTVVVGGRGVEGDFTMVKELADALGGAVGATRVACDEGWAPRGEQIGQTGLSVSPNLYVGLGVSGAVHHTVGMQSSAHIVAVCDDPDAPIFELADFGVVGDVAEVVPQALDEIRKARAAE